MNTERKPAQNALWAYLLQKDLPVSSIPSATPVIPPMTPVDRTNTSMRMLIHDLQATLERFSTRVDALLNNIKDTKTEVANFSRISESEHDRVLDEITNSSRRVQIELKTCIGTPLQASALELIQKSQASAEISIQALDKRIDGIQTLIQSQNHSIQTIQDQQHAILTTVLPLLPLVQAFPLHVDQAKASIADQVKTAIADNVSSSMSRLKSDIDSMKSTLSILSASSNSMRNVPQPASEILPSRSENHHTHKRTNSWLRQDDIHPRCSQSTRLHSLSPLHSPRIDRHKKPRLNVVLPIGSPQVTRQSPYTAKPAKENPRKSIRANGMNSPTCISAANNDCSVALWPRQTKRTPLVDIPLPALVTNHVNAQPFPRSGLGTEFTANARTMYASHQAGGQPPSTQAQITSPALSVAIPIIPNTTLESDDFVPPATNQNVTRESAPAALPVTPQAVSKVIKLEEVLRSPLKDHISILSSPLSSISPSPPSPRLAPQPILKTQHQHAAGKIAQRQVAFVTSSQALIPSVGSGPEVPPAPTPDFVSVSMSLRDRRAQMSVLGRTISSAPKRFIAVGSSSDEG